MNSSNVISQDELEKLILKRDKAIESNNRFTNNVKKPEFRKKTFQNVPARYEPYSTMINNGTTFMDDGRMISRYGSIGDFGKYYRGEHKKFPNTKSKLARELNKNASETDKLSKIVIQYFRIFFMHDYIKKIRNIDKWDIGCISTDLIAQHYGLSTMFIDLTDDIRVALFFACTKTNDNGSFQYLTEYDLDNEYGRDGYIHIINKGPEFDIGIKPIGYQPFTRCHRQRGYYIDTYKQGFDQFDLNTYDGAKKYMFKRTEKFCKRIYDYFEGGAYLFPENEKRIMSEIINKINNKTTYNQKDFDAAISFLSEKDKDKVTKESLKKHGFTYFDREHILDQYIISQIDLLDFEKFMEKENINPIKLITISQNN